MTLYRDEEGQTLVITALGMAVIIGFLALAVDVGMLFRAQRQIQNAADAAATAGALDYYYNGATNVAAAAELASSNNGFTDGQNNVKVAVHCSSSAACPEGSISSTAHTGPGYVEVIVLQPVPTGFYQTFMALFSPRSNIPITVTARAEAGAPGTSDYCAYILNATASGSLSLQGSFNVNAANCGVIVDSNSQSAIAFTGNGGNITAGSIGVVGYDGAGVSGMRSGESIPPPTVGIAPVSDPLAGVVTQPNTSLLSCSAPSGGTLGGTSTITTIDAAGATVCYSGNVILDNVDLENGTFVFKGNVTFTRTVETGTGTINTAGASGATIDIANGTLSIAPPKSNFLFNFHAPTASSCPSCIDPGIALMAGPTNANTLEVDPGASCGGIYGILYAPDATLYLNDSGCDKNGGLSLTTDLIVGELNDRTATLNITSWSNSNPTLTPLKKIVLVEWKGSHDELPQKR